MKKLFLIFIIVFIIVWFLKKSSPTPTQPFLYETPSSTQTTKEGSSYTFNNQSFRVASFIAKSPKNIFLIPNFTEKTSSLTSDEMNRCAILTSAGFYSTDNKPIGLFVTDGKKLKNYEKNTLFNGFFSVDDSGAATISDEPPPETSRIALQSGPILIADGTPRRLAIHDDEPARRIVVAQTTDNVLVFLALFGEENTFEGPHLADVPNHLTEVEKLLGISITNAINLDGGSASAFITNKISLAELTPVGSFFCVQ